MRFLERSRLRCFGSKRLWFPSSNRHKIPPKTIPITQISPDTQGWVNICVADAYTVRSVKIPSGNP